MSNVRICPSCKKYKYEVGDNCCEWCGNKLPPASVQKEAVWAAKRAQTHSPAATIAAAYLITLLALAAAVFLLISVFTGRNLILFGSSSGEAAVSEISTETAAEETVGETAQTAAEETVGETTQSAATESQTAAASTDAAQ